jgi:hypothetical protein
VPEERNDSDDVAIDGRVVMSLKEVEWKSLTIFDK